MSDQAEQKEGQLNIEISEEIADGEYSNLAILTHSHAEFILDFIRIVPGAPKAKVKSRIIMTPQHAKRLMKALSDNIQKYEQTHGEVKDTNGGQTPIPMNFGGPTTQA